MNDPKLTDLIRAAKDVQENMIRIGLALRPALEHVTTIAMEAAVRDEYAHDLGEPEWEVFS